MFNASKVYGYARVSSRTQTELRQLIALHEFGVADKDIFTDKQSGKDFNRPKYLCLVKKLKPGDLFVITSIDRLGRNYDEIIEQWRVITKEKQADIVVLDMALLDTRQKERDLTGTFIADLVLQILSYVAENERCAIHARQASGIAAAMANGAKFGRPKKTPPGNFEEIRWAYLANKISVREAARRTGVCAQTFTAWLNAV